MAHYHAVLFDNGNTLFHKLPAVDAIIRLAGLQGRQVSPELARATWAAVKAGRRRGPEARLERNGSSEGHRRFYTEQYAPLDALAPGLATTFYSEFKTSPGSMVAYPDSAPTLSALRSAGVKVGVVSNTGWDIRRGYRASGLEPLVDCFVLSYEHATAKPDVALFARACTELSTAPEGVLMVGNDAEADGGAAELGCTCLILAEVAPGRPRGLDAVLRLAGVPAISQLPSAPPSPAYYLPAAPSDDGMAAVVLSGP